MVFLKHNAYIISSLFLNEEEKIYVVNLVSTIAIVIE
jgi:hypothetical protein